MRRRRAAGILLHVSSLPGRHAIGDLGPKAYEFVDLLAAAAQSYWQILPLNPPVPCKGSYSPYSCSSAFAGNTLLISPELLYRDGLLRRRDITPTTPSRKDRVDFKAVIRYKRRLLEKAFHTFKAFSDRDEYERFCADNNAWLDDFAAFSALRASRAKQLWCQWPAGLRDRKPKALASVIARLSEEIDRHKFLQYVFLKQWNALKSYSNSQGVSIIGDIPLYVAYDSADVWAHPEVFKLGKSKRPSLVAGVPPDYFSSDGQLWGNPVYDWNAIRDERYCWWKHRIAHNLNMFDIVRIDHFRGIVASWQVSARASTARKGHWMPGPGREFFDRCLPKRSMLDRVIAEDLGHITPDVYELMKKLRIRGMRVLLFGFDGDRRKNPHYPANHIPDSVAYTGTHDTNTARGWFDKEARVRQKKCLTECIGRKVTARTAAPELVQLAMNSAADTAIIPMQDILGLDGAARMNRPAGTRNNWLWRLKSLSGTARHIEKLAELTATSGRS